MLNWWVLEISAHFFFLCITELIAFLFLINLGDISGAPDECDFGTGAYIFVGVRLRYAHVHVHPLLSAMQQLARAGQHTDSS